jgi:hypothetical protein
VSAERRTDPMSAPRGPLLFADIDTPGLRSLAT